MSLLQDPGAPVDAFSFHVISWIVSDEVFGKRGLWVYNMDKALEKGRAYEMSTNRGRSMLGVHILEGHIEIDEERCWAATAQVRA